MMNLARLRKALSQPVFGATEPRGRRRERGVALLLVISSVAILTAVAVDFQYNASVDLQLAANSRDELRAEYLAQSGVNLSRLMLRFQRQLDGQSKTLGPMLQQLMGSLGSLGGAAGAGGANPLAGAAGGGSLNIRLWEIMPIDNSLFSMLLGAAQPSLPPLGEADAVDEDGQPLQRSHFGDFDGAFHAEVSDEEQKINLNRLNNGAATGQAPMQQALAMLADPRLEFVFEKDDANGVRLTSQEVLIAIHDWIDERDTQASLNLTGTGDPFPDGFGDENRNYASRYPHRYRSKNAPFDSLDELYQVDGVSDLFMAAFRDRLTVYPDKNKLLNINTNDPLQQYINVVSVALNPNDPQLKNPLTIQAILQEINLTKMMMPFIGMSSQSFVSIVERNGIAIKADLKANLANNRWISDQSETFTIKATGEAGKVAKKVTAVVRYNEALGKVLYYRSE